MRAYQFDLGDSDLGALGPCAVVRAENRRGAVRRLRSLLVTRIGGCGQVTLHENRADGEYINFYQQPDRVTADDIDAAWIKR